MNLAEFEKMESKRINVVPPKNRICFEAEERSGLLERQWAGFDIHENLKQF